MKISLIVVGRLKAGPERDLSERYRGRIDPMSRQLGFGPLDVVELTEDRSRSAASRRAAEAAAILARVGDAELVALDERGRSVTSVEFADRLRERRDAGGVAVAFVIGGPDGLDAACRERAALCLSFGRLTIPHQVVRILVVEQIYRAMTILSGHPYHRDGDGLP